MLLLSHSAYSYLFDAFIKVIQPVPKKLVAHYTGCIKKTEQILNRSQRREAAQSMEFLINIDCLGTYDVE